MYAAGSSNTWEYCLRNEGPEFTAERLRSSISYSTKDALKQAAISATFLVAAIFIPSNVNKVGAVAASVVFGALAGCNMRKRNSLIAFRNQNGLGPKPDQSHLAPYKIEAPKGPAAS